MIATEGVSMRDIEPGVADVETSPSSSAPAPGATDARAFFDGASLNQSAVIEIRGLVKRYGTFAAVDGIDLTVHPNEIFGILGPNGAGKTTTLEMVEGLRSPDRGTVRVAGLDVVRNSTVVKRLIGVQLQSTALFDYLTARELVSLFASLYGADSSRERIDGLIAQVALQEKADSFVNTLSGGQQQRLSIALALVNDPVIVFLDEPTTGLDPQARRNLWDVIRTVRSGGKTIVLTTHYMEEAEILCDRVAVMDQGKIIACDTPRNLIDTLNLPSTLRIRVDGPLAEMPLEWLMQWPGVEDAERTGDLLEIRTADVAKTIEDLFAYVNANGGHLDNLSSASATLEDVFLHYTGRRLRE
jgi:ABC-2 type transport system ATP-binding protein